MFVAIAVAFGLLLSGTVAPSRVLEHADAAEYWWCVNENPCPSSAEVRSSPSVQNRSGIMAAIIGNVTTEYIWKYSDTFPYEVCDANGCRVVGEVEVSAQITLNGTVHRVEMTARPLSGPKIQPILYRRCAAQNGALPDTTCGEDNTQADDFLDSTQSYSATTNYNGVDADTYYYVFQWSWNVEGWPGTPASGLGQSHAFNCDGSFCSFPR